MPAEFVTQILTLAPTNQMAALGFLGRVANNGPFAMPLTQFGRTTPTLDQNGTKFGPIGKSAPIEPKFGTDLLVTLSHKIDPSGTPGTNSVRTCGRLNPEITTFKARLTIA